MAYRRKNGRWCAHVIVNGKRTSRVFDTRALAELAEQRSRRQQERIRSGIETAEERHEADKTQTRIDVAARCLLADLEVRVEEGDITRGRARNVYRGALRAASLMNMTTVSHITEQAILALEGRLISDGLSRASVRFYSQALRELRRFTVHGRRPSRAKEPPKRVARALSPVEVQRLVALPTERVVFYITAFFTGIRWEELDRLEWRDVNLDDGIVFLRDEATKSRRNDPVPLPSIVREHLVADRFGIGSTRVFAGVPTRRTWQNDLKRARVDFRSAAGTAFRKCARMTFSTWLAKAGVPDDRRKRLLRHVDGLVNTSYTDRMKLMPEMAADSDTLVAWYRGQLNRKVTA